MPLNVRFVQDVTGTTIITSSDFIGNVATNTEGRRGGAAIHISDANATIDSCYFEANRAAYPGGSVHAASSSFSSAEIYMTVNISNSLFLNNTCTRVSVLGCPPTRTFSTFDFDCLSIGALLAPCQVLSPLPAHWPFVRFAGKVDEAHMLANLNGCPSVFAPAHGLGCHSCTLFLPGLALGLHAERVCTLLQQLFLCACSGVRVSERRSCALQHMRGHSAQLLVCQQHGPERGCLSRARGNSSVRSQFDILSKQSNARGMGQA